LSHALPRALRREFPGLFWAPSLTDVKGPAPAIIRSPTGLAVRIQLLSAVGYPRWPTQIAELTQRYSDAPAARLVVPTAAGFAAAKAAAWHDRRTSRDLWDLWALAERQHLTAEAAEIYARLGPTGRRPLATDYANPPEQTNWVRDLSARYA
jgi:hypothetical protein